MDDIERIAGLADPVLRNLRITQCYHELDEALRRLDGSQANWCTFATWASKQAGQTIRDEDLVRHFQDEFRRSPEVVAAIGALTEVVKESGVVTAASALAADQLLPALNPAAAVRRASDAVARGNRKVFEEIGREFARYIARFGGDAVFDAEKLARFCAGLRPGDPPDGQRRLRDAFTAYGEARFQTDAAGKAELTFLANLLAGFHEQTRLQPEIAEALNAAINGDQMKQLMLVKILPGFWLRWRHRVARFFGRRPPLDVVLDRLLREAQRLIRKVITHHLMTLHLPGEVLRLGSDLPTGHAPSLGKLTNARLKELLPRIDPTPDNVTESGARDWADFDDRMHFITDFFRCYHEREELFRPPFGDDQITDLRAGRVPRGEL